ncbi:MAG: DUF1080 domain-containing protein [Planctomycetales bacterium]|nr:DUF1080 domain-containing protein [Planctomycetales bacterium]
MRAVHNPIAVVAVEFCCSKSDDATWPGRACWLRLQKLAAIRWTFLVAMLIQSAVVCNVGYVQAQTSISYGPEWKSLFNGRDLDGWVKIGNEKWIVEDGAIYGEGITQEYGYLATAKEYTDFDMSLRFKCEADGNSGVYIHTSFEPGTAKVTAGRQIEIDRTIGHHTGGIYGDGKGWIAWPAPELETVIRPNDWNEMLIQVQGRRYITHLNGVKMLDFTYPSPEARSGVIALQLHSGGEGRMRFKDIWIRANDN